MPWRQVAWEVLIFWVISAHENLKISDGLISITMEGLNSMEGVYSIFSHFYLPISRSKPLPKKINKEKIDKTTKMIKK